MKVILRVDIPSLGKERDIVEVSNGYARNFLIPKKMAYEYTKGNLKKIEEEKKQKIIKEEKEKKDALKLAEKIANMSISIKVQAGEDEKMFGSVTSADIAEELAKQGIEIDKKKIILEEPIKALGVYTIVIKLYKDISTKLKVWVEK